MNAGSFAVACALATAVRDAKRVCTSPAPRYTFGVPETTGARASRLDSSVADNRQLAVFFRPYAFARLLQWRALAEGTPSGVPVSTDAGPRTPKPCACHHRFAAVMAGFETAVCGGRTMRHIPARPEQAESLLEIIRSALRGAATAPTAFDALDVCGDALRRLSEIAGAEADHAR